MTGVRLLAVLALLTGVARAHEVRPSYVELRERVAGVWDVLWKVPARGEDRRLALSLRLPARCRSIIAPSAAIVAGAYVERSRVACAGGLAGQEVRIDGLSATLTDVLARVEWADGRTQVTRLTPDRPAFAVEAAPRVLDVVRTYLPLGVEHILTGVDHLLFVLALLLLVDGFGRLVRTVSAFTLSHSLTLAAATLGFIHLPSAPVEAVIALSIVFVAREVLRRHAGGTSAAVRRPWLVAFAFGLLHGLGFASGLDAAGLPAGHIPLALALFSAGVEIGHVSFVAVVLVVMAAMRRLPVERVAWMRAIPAYAIGSVAMFWTIQRITAF